MVPAIALMLMPGAPVQTAAKHDALTGLTVATILYYVLAGLTALVAGLFVTVIVMLYGGIQKVIGVVSPVPGLQAGIVW